MQGEVNQLNSPAKSNCNRNMSPRSLTLPNCGVLPRRGPRTHGTSGMLAGRGVTPAGDTGRGRRPGTPKTRGTLGTLRDAGPAKDFGISCFLPSAFGPSQSESAELEKARSNALKCIVDSSRSSCCISRRIQASAL
eukprot:906840-Amphidinium_carterae.1